MAKIKPQVAKKKDAVVDVCPVCGGRGKYTFEDKPVRCHACKGRGRININETPEQFKEKSKPKPKKDEVKHGS